jgi:hypothetical protein
MRLLKYLITINFILLVFVTTCLTDQTYTITLKTGSIIKTDVYNEDGDMLYYQKYGTMIGIKKSTVDSIDSNDPEKESSPGVAVEYYGYIKQPEYFRMSGFTKRHNKVYNGLYEANGEHNDYPKYYNIEGRGTLFYHCNSGEEKRCGYALGSVSRNTRSISFINYNDADASSPDASNVWTTSTGKVRYPDVTVTRAGPPPLASEGIYKLAAKHFPFEEVNGLYKPLRVYRGRIRYRHETQDYELYYSGDSWNLDRCVNGCYNTYVARKMAPDSMPQDIHQWHDISGRRIAGQFVQYDQQ